MKNNLNFVYITNARHAVLVLDKYGRAMAIKGREIDIAIAEGEEKELIRRRLSDPDYQTQMHTEPIGVYKDYNMLHRFLINVINFFFGVKTK